MTLGASTIVGVERTVGFGVTDRGVDGMAAMRVAAGCGADWANAVPTPARPTADTTATNARNILIDGPLDSGLGIPLSRSEPAGKWYRGAQACGSAAGQRAQRAVRPSASVW
ncbi:MAG: hypothetical protein NVS3B12_02620 [Acidimicrobiales bacterium]